MKRAIKQKVTCLSIFLFSLSCILFITFHKADAQPKYGGTLRPSPNIDFPDIGYPPKHVGPVPLRQAAPAVETLFRVDKTGQKAPWLALEAKEDSIAKTITLILRKGVKFHDGTDFNADAVKWNLERQWEAKSGGTKKFKSIETIDDYTVRINLTEWDNTVSSGFSLSLGGIISPTACEKNGKEWAALNPVGTGPFKFSTWKKDVICAFDRFDGYWQKGKPYLDRIEWIIIADSVTREMSFRAGELDVIMTIPCKNIKQLKKDGYNVTGREMGSGAEGLVPSSGSPNSPWSNLKVRQAAAHAINNEEMVEGVYLNEAVATDQYSYPGHWSHNPNIVGYPYDPGKAKKLLAEAGYPKGFKTKMYCSPDPTENLRYMAAQGYLAEIGIDCELVPLVRTEENKYLRGGETWDGLIREGPSASPDLAFQLADYFMGDGKHYVSMLTPEDYVNAINNAITASDFETKQKWTHEALKLMIDKYCLHIPFVARYDHVISQAWVHDHGFQKTDNMLWAPEDCWIDRK